MDTSRAIPESHPLHRLFRGLTEYAFMNELGIGDPPLVGYVAELLASFVPSQSRLATPRRARPAAEPSYGDDRRSRGGRRRRAATRMPSPRRRFHALLDRASIPRPWPSCKGRARPTHWSVTSSRASGRTTWPAR